MQERAFIWEGGKGLRNSPVFTKLKSQVMLWVEMDSVVKRTWEGP